MTSSRILFESCCSLLSNQIKSNAFSFFFNAHLTNRVIAEVFSQSNKGHNYRQREEHRANIAPTGESAGLFVCLQCPRVGNLLMGVFVFCHSVYGRRGGNGKLCTPPPPPTLLFSPFLFSLTHPHQIFNGLHWCHRGISVAKALKGLKSAPC